MIISDCHLHTTFSTDGVSDMESMILAGIKKGLKYMCFTEHNDFGAEFREGPDAFQVDTKAYHTKFMELKEKYKGRIELLFGVEIGLLPGLSDHFNEYAAQYPFDFIIGSSHFAGGLDPYLPEYYDRFSSPHEAYRFYFESELKCAEEFNCFDSYGHIDYALRYGPDNQDFQYSDYADLLDELLKTLINKGKMFEINSKGYRTSIKRANPDISVLRRYRELGGEAVTIGSDAHCTDDIASGFEQVHGLLEEAGFRYCALFRERKAEMLPL